MTTHTHTESHMHTQLVSEKVWPCDSASSAACPALACEVFGPDGMCDGCAEGTLSASVQNRVTVKNRRKVSAPTRAAD